MTTSTSDAAVPPTANEPAPAPAPAPASIAPRPKPRGLLAATAVIATVGVVVALIGLALMFRPVTTPTQDCGTSIGFLLDGRVNEFVDVNDLPEGVTKADAEANNDEPCRDRVGDAVKPAAVLFLAGLIASLGAACIETGVRTAGWVHRRRQRRAVEDAGVVGPADLPPPIA